MLICSIFKIKDYNHILKEKGVDMIELRLDLMSLQDLESLKTASPEFAVPVLIAIKPSLCDESLILQICKKINPQFIDLDYSLFAYFEQKIKKICPKASILISKHSKNLYDLDKFYRKNKHIHLKKFVLETEDSYLALQLAFKAQKQNLILFSSGIRTSFSRFFSAWHYTYVSEPTGIGQIQLDELIKNYSSKTSIRSFYALIGDPLKQSLSHVTHNYIFQMNKYLEIYLKIPLNVEEFAKSLAFFQKLGCKGLSITTPLKQKAKQLLSPKSALYAINTFDLVQETATNTDLLALKELVKLSPKHESCLLLGDGDCARSFLPFLQISFKNCDQWSRKNPCLLNTEYNIIINATSSPDPLAVLPKCFLLINLHRNQPTSGIEIKALAYKSKIIDGQMFFYTQALHQLEFWKKDLKKFTYNQFFSLVKEPLGHIESQICH
jgi:3-dehydroquinate dehydratase